MQRKSSRIHISTKSIQIKNDVASSRSTPRKSTVDWKQSMGVENCTVLRKSLLNKIDTSTHENLFSANRSPKSTFVRLTPTANLPEIASPQQSKTKLGEILRDNKSQLKKLEEVLYAAQKSSQSKVTNNEKLDLKSMSEKRLFKGNRSKNFMKAFLAEDRHESGLRAEMTNQRQDSTISESKKHEFLKQASMNSATMFRHTRMRSDPFTISKRSPPQDIVLNPDGRDMEAGNHRVESVSLRPSSRATITVKGTPIKKQSAALDILYNLDDQVVLLTGDKAVQEVWAEVQRLNFDPKSLLETVFTHTSSYYDSKLFVFGGAPISCFPNACYDLQTQVLTPVDFACDANIIKRSGISSAAKPGTPFVFSYGGEHMEIYDGTLIRYDLKSQKAEVQHLSPYFDQPPARRYSSLSFLSDHLFLYAGIDGFRNLLGDLWSWSQSKAAWFTYRLLDESRSVCLERYGHRMVSVPSSFGQFKQNTIVFNSLIVFGGILDNEVFSDDLLLVKFSKHSRTARFDPLPTSGAMPEARAFHSLEYIKKQHWLVVIGGHNIRGNLETNRSEIFFKDIHVLNLSTLCWMTVKQIGEMPAKFKHSSATNENEIFIFSGFQEDYYVCCDVYKMTLKCNFLEVKGPENPEESLRERLILEKNFEEKQTESLRRILSHRINSYYPVTGINQSSKMVEAAHASSKHTNPRVYF